MCINWRFLQLGVLCACLSACSTPAAQRPATPSIDKANSANAVSAEAQPASSTTRPGKLAQAGRSRSSPQGRTLAASPLRPEVYAYIQQVSRERGLPVDWLTQVMAGAQYSSVVARLIAPTRHGKKIVRSWTIYRDHVVEPRRVRWGAEFWQENKDLLARAQQRYGVPASIIAAIIGVETNYARNTGSIRVLDALTTLAFDYPDASRPERQKMFRGQLTDFLTLAFDGRLDLESTGSFAGAIGMAQFMPGSILQFAIDGDGDGHIDLKNNVADAVMSVGNFLTAHGWHRGLPVFAPVTLPADASALVDGDLEPDLDWPSLKQAGARARAGAANDTWQHRPLGVINLPDDRYQTAEYRVGTENFFALTKYNRSYFYASAVADLADALQSQLKTPVDR